jgi:hypothetical protein
VNVNDVFVPAERAVPFKALEQPSPAYSGPWHRLTIWPSVAGAAIPALGIAQAAIDEFAELATKKTPSDAKLSGSRVVATDTSMPLRANALASA